MAVGGDWKIRLLQGDGAGGAGDVLEVLGQCFNEGLLSDGTAELADAGLGEGFHKGIQLGKKQGGLAGSRKVGGAVAAEGLNTVGAVVAADVFVVHCRWGGGLMVLAAMDEAIKPIDFKDSGGQTSSK